MFLCGSGIEIWHIQNQLCVLIMDLSVKPHQMIINLNQGRF